MQTIEYEYVERHEVFGGFSLQLKTLANFENTVDQIFAHLQKHNRPELLEDLCPYFGYLWAAARGLTQHIAQMPDAAIAGKKILELGCGLAAPSILAALRGGDVVASDYHPDVGALLAENCRRNGVDPITYAHLDWRRPEAWSKRPWDSIMASDVLYDATQPELLASVLTALAQEGTRIIVADPGRGYLQKFCDAMSVRNFHMISTGQSGEYKNGAEDVYVLEFSR